MAKLVTRLAAATMLMTGFATSAHAAPIVTDGSFENGLSGWTTSGSGTTPGIGITTLTTGGANTTGYGDDVPNFDGTHAAFFVDDNANENLSQLVSLVGGQQYLLSFALFATVSGDANPFGFRLVDSLGSDIISSQGNHSMGNPGDQVPVGQWTTYSYAFSAPTTSNYLLNFNFLSSLTPSKDVLLDAVNISPVTVSAAPEPASWALMIAGFGVAGGALRRRRVTNTSVRFA
jgi:hypothetical protein